MENVQIGEEVTLRDQWNSGPRRYFVNEEGYRVLIGLSLEETTEFERLDRPSVCTETQRWSELYAKHDTAWKVWIAQSRTEPPANLAYS